MSYAANPRHPENPSSSTEPSGPIASDSLAADSLRRGGDFAANDPSNPEPLGVKGAASTLANTDTGGAVPLHPAPSGTAREIQDTQGLGRDEKGVSGVKYPEGAGGQPSLHGTTTSAGRYYGGPSSDRPSEGYATGAAAGASDVGASTLQDTSPSTSATGGIPSTSRASGSSSVPTPGMSARPYVPEGPTYTGRVAGTLATEGEYQPKGRNLTEGDIPATKTFLGDVGGPHDPGREAERGFEKINADVPGGGVGSGRDYQTAKGEGEDKGGFEVLGSERA